MSFARDKQRSGPMPVARPTLVRYRVATLLTLLPLVFLLVVVVRFAVGVPFLDQWELVPLLEKLHGGTLSFADLWAQHNEHRILFPRLIMLTLAWASDWNTHLELETSVVLACGILVVYALQVKATARKLDRPDLIWAIPLASIVVFSVSQHENWLWGWQLQMFLNVFCVVAAVLVLTNGAFSWTRFAAAAALGVGATYAFANGPLFWPIGLLVLGVVATRGRQRRAAVCIWILVAGLALSANYLDYHKPQHHPALGLVLKMPMEYARYVFKYLGGIVEPGIFRRSDLDGALATLLGWAGAVTFAWTVWRLLGTGAVSFRTLLPYLAVSLYSLGSALGTGVGRLGFGSGQAMASRYCTMVTPFWVSLLVLLALLGYGKVAALPKVGDKILRRRRKIAQCLLWGFTALLATGSYFAVSRAREHYDALVLARTKLLNVGLHPRDAIDLKALQPLYPQPRTVVDRAPVLVRYRLSLFRGLK
jgi:hypothetical protein